MSRSNDKTEAVFVGKPLDGLLKSFISGMYMGIEELLQIRKHSIVCRQQNDFTPMGNNAINLQGYAGNGVYDMTTEQIKGGLKMQSRDYIIRFDLSNIPTKITSPTKLTWTFDNGLPSECVYPLNYKNVIIKKGGMTSYLCMDCHFTLTHEKEIQVEQKDGNNTFTYRPLLNMTVALMPKSVTMAKLIHGNKYRTSGITLR